MKNLFVIFSLATILFSCNSMSRNNVSGSLSGVTTDTILIRSILLANMDIVSHIDTIPLVNGEFSIYWPDSNAVILSITQKPSSVVSPDGSTPAYTRPIEFLLLPGEKVKIIGSFNDYNVEGGPFYTELSELKNSYSNIQAQIEAIQDQCRKLQSSGVPSDSIYEIGKEMYPLYDSIATRRANYVKTNLGKLSSLYVMPNLMSKLSTEEIKKILDSFSDEIKTGALAPLYDRVNTTYQKMVEKEKAKEKLQIGMPAPDFTANTLAGKPFTLSSLKGKYVVLDFWGSWCGWCIKGFPDMKKTYAKYKSKIEFVGIDCGDTDEKWRAAVEKNTLPWINVYNTDQNDIATLYAVDGFPTKYVLDKDGNILTVVQGEGPTFYTFIDELMKK